MHMITVTLQAVHITLTDAITDYATTKVQALSRFTRDEEIDAQVTVGKTSEHHQKGQVFLCEVHLKGPDTKIMAKEVTEDLYAAIDAVVAKLKRQLTA